MKIDSPSRDQVPALRELWKAAFDDPEEYLDQFFSQAFSPDRCRCMTVGDRVAAALYWFDTRVATRHFAYLYAVATDPEFRNRGYCRALIGNTLSLLRAQGFAGALLVPENDGLANMYSTMGFLPCTTIRELTCDAGSKPVAMEQISAAEFAELRKKFLPDGGVIQDGADLRLLAENTLFYAGADYLAAIDSEHGFRGLELLGNADAAPGILRALGVNRGTFRTPGCDSPFAMLCPLAEDCPFPSYFGFPLD